jgi:hypothetical protein
VPGKTARAITAWEWTSRAVLRIIPARSMADLFSGRATQPNAEANEN